MRRLVSRMIASPLVGLIAGCAPLFGIESCDPPRATDAAFGSVGLQCYAPPCGAGTQVPRGSDPHLVLTFQCPGESEPFLAAVKIDGRLFSLVEVRGSGTYSPDVYVDLGAWQPADTVWHPVEVVIDPLNLFTETNESNNRGTAQVRVVDPDVGVVEPCGFMLPGDFSNMVSVVPFGTAVDVRHRMSYDGPYETVVRSVRSGTALEATSVVGFTACGAYPYQVNIPDFITRWTPPAPGDYDVEFRVEPTRPTTDRIPSNNVVTKRLTVTPPSPAGAAR